MSVKTTRKLSRVFYSSLPTKDYFKDYVNKPVACINAIFIRFVVSLRLQKEVIGSGLENTFQNHEKEHSGHDENNFFFYSIFYFTTFF